MFGFPSYKWFVKFYIICDTSKFRTKVISWKDKMRDNIYIKKPNDNGDGERKITGRRGKAMRCAGKATPSCLA